MEHIIEHSGMLRAFRVSHDVLKRICGYDRKRQSERRLHFCLLMSTANEYLNPRKSSALTL